MTATTKTKSDESKALQEYEKRIRAVARDIGYRGSDHEDLIQEGRCAFLIAYRRFNAERDAALWTYARRFVEGAMRRAARKDRRAPIAAGDDVPDVADDYTPNPEDVAAVRELLKTLSPEERRIVESYVGGGQTLESVATETGYTARGIKWVCDRALSKMRAA